MPLYIPVSGSEPSDFQPAIVTGNYYYPIGSQTTAPIPADLLYAWPIWFSSTETWTRIGIYVDTGVAATNARIGVYANGADNRPGALVLDAGTVSTATTGEKEITISQSLTANTVYWLAVVSDDASGMGSLQMMQAGGADDIDRRLGVTAAVATGVGYSKGHVYAALPDPYGTPDDPDQGCPAIWLRKV